jgi:adenylate cyclase
VDGTGWLEELKRRRVFRALVGYGVVSFALLQVIEPVMHGLNLPEWVLTFTVLGLGLGFPITLVLAWIFDVRGGRIEAAPGKPRKRVLLALAAAGVGLAAPGVLFYLRRSRPAPAPAPVAEATPSIAVLPFADLSPAHDQDWMCEGIAEEILDALCTVDGLRVAARSSSFVFKGKQADVREMARALGVTTLLEGSVRKLGDRLRVTARLVSAAGYELWTDKFDRAASDAFAIQDEIARSVASALRLRMQPAAGSPTGTTNAQAWELYLRGRQYLRLTGAENSEQARRLFKQAVALDPGFAQAHAGAADAGATLLLWALLPAESQPPLRAEVLKESDEALRLQPNLAEAHVARGNVLAALGRKQEADASFQQAVQLAPGLRDAWYFRARFLFSIGRYADSAASFEAAAERDPDDYDSLNLASMQYNKLGQPAKALARVKQSIAAADRVLQKRPEEVRALYMSGESMINLGEVRSGLERVDRAVAIEPHEFAVLYNGACAYARAGQPARALDLLDRAVDKGRGFRSWIEADPDLDSLHPSPRWQQILARIPP